MKFSQIRTLTDEDKQTAPIICGNTPVDDPDKPPC
jgi:hypothetical protein